MGALEQFCLASSGGSGDEQPGFGDRRLSAFWEEDDNSHQARRSQVSPQMVGVGRPVSGDGISRIQNFSSVVDEQILESQAGQKKVKKEKKEKKDKKMKGKKGNASTDVNVPLGLSQGIADPIEGAFALDDDSSSDEDEKAPVSPQSIRTASGDDRIPTPSRPVDTEQTSETQAPPKKAKKEKKEKKEKKSKGKKSKASPDDGLSLRIPQGIADPIEGAFALD